MSMHHSDVGLEGMLRVLARGGAKIHFVGIFGEGMAPLAELMHERGYAVSGSDIRAPHGEHRLLSLGIPVSYSHKTALAAAADLLVYTLAIGEDDPELSEARLRGITCVSRAQLLGAVMTEYRNRIGVMGTHGKSTTVAMIHRVLSDAGLCPTTLSGAALECGTSLSVGGREWFVYESCEYRDSFLHFYPTHAVVTNIELDHTDYFPDIDTLCASFSNAAGRASAGVLLSMDDGNCRKIGKSRGRVSFFGTDAGSDYRMTELLLTPLGSRFVIDHKGDLPRGIELCVPGEANARDALAAFALCRTVGIEPCVIADALRRFGGIGRRLEYLGSIQDRPVYYDYAHHPTEILNTVSAIGHICPKMCAIFRPHTYSRTEALYDDFCRVLSRFDRTVVLPVFAARESKGDCRGSRELARDIKGGVYIPMNEAVNYVVGQTEGAIVLLGAGDVDAIKKELLSLM